MTEPQRVAVIGAGRVGTALASLAVAAGCVVTLAGSGSPARTRTIAGMFAPGAESAWTSEAVAGADLVVLAVPLTVALDEFDPDDFVDRVVVDATNYWPETDGHRSELDDVATSQLVQARLSRSRVVKALNHVAYRDLVARARPDAPMLAIGVAGDDAAATERVSAFVRRLGFAPMVVGPLASSAILGPRSAVFGAALGPEAFLARLAEDGWCPSG